MAYAVFEWEAKEYVREEKSADWYWALGIIATAVVIVCILFNNILLGLVIAAGCGALALAAARRPEIHRFAVTDEGVAIDNRLYPYGAMRTFSVLEYIDTNIPPHLSIKTNHVLAPHITMPIVDHDPMEIYEYVSQHVEEGRHDVPSAMDHAVGLFRL
jgi:hypothetical protein